MQIAGISVCVFDAYGTLFDVRRVVLGAMPGEAGEAFYALWRGKQLEYSWLRSLMGRHADFWHVTGQSLDYTMTARKVADPGLRARLMEGFFAPPAFEDALPTLDALGEAGRRLAILSNGEPSMLTAAISRNQMGARLDAVLSVESVAVFKPHPAVYHLAVEHFACQPTEIAFISANGWDVAGAAAVGLRTVWVNRDGAPRDELPGAPDAVVASLSELPALIAA